MRRAFNFFNSYWSIANELSDKDRLQFYDALMLYQFTGDKSKIEALTGMAKFAYVSQSHSIESQISGYLDVCKRHNNEPFGNKKTPPTVPPTAPPTVGGTVAPKLQEKEEVQVQVKVQEKGKVQEKEKEVSVKKESEKKKKCFSLSSLPSFEQIEFTDNRKKELFVKWMDYRKEIGKQIKVLSTINELRSTFERESFEKIEYTVHLSIRNNWQGLFWERFDELQTKNNGKPKQPTDATERNRLDSERSTQRILAELHKDLHDDKTERSDSF